MRDQRNSAVLSTEVMMAHNNNHASVETGDLRLFIALWPDEPTRPQIVLQRDNQGWVSGARTVPEANLHITLIFMGGVSRPMLPTLVDRLASVPCVPMALYFDRIEDWGDGLVVLCPREIPAALTRLHRRLQEVQQALGLPVESRPYRPHVTLARHAMGTALTQPTAPIRWSARSFVLAQSDPSGVYKVLHDFRC